MKLEKSSVHWRIITVQHERVDVWKFDSLEKAKQSLCKLWNGTWAIKYSAGVNENETRDNYFPYQSGQLLWSEEILKKAETIPQQVGIQGIWQGVDNA